MFTYKKIMVAMDGSNQAHEAYKKGVAIAQRNHGTLLLVFVVDARPFQQMEKLDDVLIEESNSSASAYLKPLVAEAVAAGVACEINISYGSPKQLIATDIPEKYGIDLLLLGASGLNAIERMLLGSISEYVVRHAKCDVLICR
ncbi:universal stress protein [Enterococcus timonensis]|uniref:universal stress protein n=1 Tax=Enterococcus timonensis TaxID=1852364 RepID=UPI0008D9AC99|nr:universal stress protein [Enterococcus timonensis]